MSKYFFFLLLMFSVSAGCTMLDRNQPPNVTTAPPYWQSESQRQLADRQLGEMRAFHEKESVKMTDDMHVFRNHEMERLESVGEELKKDKLWQEDYEKTVEKRKKWTSWFKSKPKADTNINNTPSVTMSEAKNTAR